MAQNYIEQANKYNNDFTSEQNYETELNTKEIDDIKKKTQELIEAKPFNREHIVEPNKIKQEAIDTIEKVMREKIPENFYNSVNSINSDKNNDNVNYDDIENLDEFKFGEESKEIERDNNSFNSNRLKLIKRAKRK